MLNRAAVVATDTEHTENPKSWPVPTALLSAVLRYDAAPCAVCAAPCAQFLSRLLWFNGARA